MDFTKPSTAPSSIAILIGALILLSFFIPLHVSAGGVRVSISDLIGLASVPLAFLTLLTGSFQRIWNHHSLFLFLFCIYILLNGAFKGLLFSPLLYIEFIQWVSIHALLSLLFGYHLLQDRRTYLLLTYLLFGLCVVVALLHLKDGYQYGFKLMGVSKYAFGITCVFLYALRDRVRYYPVLMAAAVTMLFFSQERKGLFAFLIVVFADQVFYKAWFERTISQLRWRLFAVFGLFFSVTTLAYLTYFGAGPLINLLQISPLDLAFADQHSALYVSDIHRKLLIFNGLDIVSQNLFFGVGAKMLPEYMVNYFAYPELAIYTHNFLLDTTVEYGVIGSLLLFGGYVIFIYKLIKYRQADYANVLIATYALVSVFFSAVNTTVIFVFVLPILASVFAPKGGSSDAVTNQTLQER